MEQNTKLLGTQIEAITEGHGERIVQLYKDNGFDTMGLTGVACRTKYLSHRFYGVDQSGLFMARREHSGLKTITIRQVEELFNITAK
jgi:hypothetical protein